MSSSSPQGIIACSITLSIISITAVSLRFYARSQNEVKMGLEDWIQIPSLLLFVGMCSTALYGTAQHAWGPLAPTATGAYVTNLFALLLFPENILMVITDTMIKVSALCFYRRLFCIQRPSIFNTFLMCSIGLVTLFGLVFLGWFIGLCGSHPDAIWASEQSFEKYCVKQPEWVLGFSITDFVATCLVMMVPLPTIWNLKTTLARKASITGVFLLALVGLGASLARVITSVQIAALVSKADRDLDIYVDVGALDTRSVWIALLETGCSLIAVNLPTLGNLVHGFSSASILKSLLSIVSRQSDRPLGVTTHQGIASNSPYIRTNSLSNNDNIELVPGQKKLGWYSTIDGSTKSNMEDGDTWRDIESGIHVHRKVEQVSIVREI